MTVVQFGDKMIDMQKGRFYFNVSVSKRDMTVLETKN